MNTASLNQNGPCQGQDDGLRVLYWNAGGLNTSKLILFRRLLLHVDADLYFITEAGAATDSPEYYPVPGYSTQILKRARQIASGIYYGIKEGRVSRNNILHEMDRDDKLEAVKIEIWKYHKKYTIFGLYNPPGNVPNLDVIDTQEKNLLVIGDFNAPSIRWGYASTSAVGRTVEDFSDDNLLQVVDTPPTFLSFAGSTSRPDLVLVHPDIFAKTSVKLMEDGAGCGHRALLVSVPATKKPPPSQRIPRWNFKKANWNKFASETDLAITPDIITKCPDQSYKVFCEKVIKTAFKCVPRGQVRRYNTFWSSALTKLKKERNDARKKAEATKLLSDCADLRRKQAELQRSICESKRKVFREFIAELDYHKDGVKVHKFVSRLKGEHTARSAQPLKIGNKLITHPKDMANAICAYYVNVSRIPVPHARMKIPPGALTCLSKEESEIFEDPFTMQEMLCAFESVKAKKSAGPDNIFPEFLLNLGPIAKNTLLDLFNLTWNSYLPDMWRKGEIIPLLKKGKPADAPASYRPIALTSACCKIAERLVVNRLVRYLESRGLIDDAQAGFRKHRSTMDQALTFTQFVKDGFQRQMSTVAVLVDFKAAYDRVWRGLLLHKLRTSVITSRLFKWIRSFLAQRQIRVRFQNEVSRFRIQKAGLPQGAVLSCTLFNVMINDVLDTVRSVPGVEALLYADDLLIWATSRSWQGIEGCLNSALCRLAEWADKNAMTVSPEKTICQVFTLAKSMQEITLTYKGNKLEERSIAQYLGISLDSKMTWKAHIEEIVAKGTKRCRLLKRLTATKWGASSDVLSTTYKCYVRPAMEYGGEVIGSASKTQLSKLDKVQNVALRTITGGVKSTPILAMELQTGIESLETRRDKTLLKTWERMKRTRPNFWKTYAAAANRLCTQHAPISRATQLAVKYNIRLGEPASLMPWQPFYSKLPSAELALQGHLLGKSHSLPVMLRKAAYHTLHARYPETEWLHVYTDGSCITGERSTGAGFYSRLFEGYCAVGSPLTNFDGEIVAVEKAAQKLSDLQGHRKAVFLVDSQAAIQALTKNSTTECRFTHRCRKTLNSLQEQGWTIVLQWIPSHVNIAGNEKADSLAKLGTTMNQPNSQASLTSAKNAIDLCVKKLIHEQRSQSAEGKQWHNLRDCPINKGLPRQVAVAVFRMTTGHDLLATHLHRIGVRDSPSCPLCDNSSMDAEHLFNCPGLAPIREASAQTGTHLAAQLYWSARRLMAELPRVGVG